MNLSSTIIKRSSLLFIVFICLPFFMYSQGISRIGNSPYPATATPDTLFMVNINSFSVTQRLAVVTLQGLLARVKPQIMLNLGAVGYINDLHTEYGVTYDSTYFTDFRGLINHFKPQFSGYILCKDNDTTTNTAISICSMLNGIAVNVADTATMDSLGVNQMFSAFGKGEQWSLDSFRNSYSKKVISIQDWSKVDFLSDYSVFANALQFFDLPSDSGASRLLSTIQTNGAVFGWFLSEQNLVTATSQHGLHMHASDWSSNLSVYTNFNIPQQHQLHHTADTILHPGVHTVCFMMTDGDNIQWLGGGFENVPNWYGNAHRGEYNIGWTISPALAELGPTQMKYIYDSATVKDGFTAAPSGLGYSYPDIFAAPDSGAAITSRIMAKADLNILNVISGNYVPSSLAPYLEQPNIDAVLYYSYENNYWGGHGFTDCINGKPVISARYNLVQPDFSTYSLARALDSMPRDPYASDGYSLVAVNVWSSPLDSVIKCIQLLDSNIRVVTPESFVKLYMAGNNCRPLPSGIRNISKANGVSVFSEPNPCTDHIQINYSLPKDSKVKTVLYDEFGKEIQVLISDHNTAGTHQVTIDTHNLSSGMYYYTLSGDYFSVSRKCLVMR